MMQLASDYGTLHGMTPDAARQRERCMSDARMFVQSLTAVLKQAAPRATNVRAQRLRTSMGAAGGYYAEYRVAGHPIYLELTINTVFTSLRADKVGISLRWSMEGAALTYLDPALTVSALGEAICTWIAASHVVSSRRARMRPSVPAPAGRFITAVLGRGQHRNSNGIPHRTRARRAACANRRLS